MDVNSFVFGVATSLVGTFIAWCIKRIIISVQERSDFNGQWETCLYDENDQIVKRDLTKVRHNRRTNWLIGKIGRTFPITQKYRRWNMAGLLLGDNIICLCWSNQMITSVNCAFFHQVSDYYYEGYYLRYSHEKNCVERRKITLKKNFAP